MILKIMSDIACEEIYVENIYSFIPFRGGLWYLRKAILLNVILLSRCSYRGFDAGNDPTTSQGSHFVNP
jgi:hypothetical protein